MLKKIISGAQTGADRAGLDAAQALGLETGGWIPRGCRTDEGNAPELKAKYGLTETQSSAYPPRTELNVRDSDGTVLFGHMDSPGCKLTLTYCRKQGKPYICNPDLVRLAVWIANHKIEVMNVAGNRERTNPGIYQSTFDTLTGSQDVEG